MSTRGKRKNPAPCRSRAIACAILLAGGMAAADEASLRLAGYFAEGELHEEAVLEYKRSIFLDRRVSNAPDPAAFLGLARSYAALGEYDAASKAYGTYRESGAHLTDETLALELEIIGETGYSGFARIRLFSLMKQIGPGSAMRERVLAANAKAAIMDGDRNGARDCVHLMIKEGFLSGTDGNRAILLISEGEKARSIPAPAAVALSAAVPGAGQALAGNPADGAKAFAVNAGSAGLTAYFFASGNPVDGIFFGVPLFLRFYVGNLQNAGEAAKAALERKKKKITDEFLAIIEKADDSR